ncbi:MAG: hypothetical protein ACREQE_07415 [Candidatus Binataceae bacterium]
MKAYIEVQLMKDPDQLADLSARALASGGLLVCDRCGDADEIIAAFMHVPDLRRNWVLCGPCLREFPRAATIV